MINVFDATEMERSKSEENKNDDKTDLIEN